MNNESGYVFINSPAILITALAVGMLLGLGAVELIELTWPAIKAWIHAATA